MRLDARKGDCAAWSVWHCPTCRPMPNVVWVDDITNEYATHVRPLRVVDGALPLQVHRVRKIQILSGPRCVLIDPIEGVDGADGQVDAVADLTQRERQYLEQRV